MKTNQILKVNFGQNVLSIGHKDKMGSLTELVKIANQYRIDEGKKPIPMDNLLRSKSVIEYALMLENKHISKGVNFTGLEITDFKQVKNVLKIKRGKNGGTWANLNLMIRVAIEMSPKFADEVISTFVQGKLLDYRDFAGDDFKLLSKSLKIFEPTTMQRIQMAKGLNYIIFNKHYADIRNEATEKDLAELTELQKNLAFSIDMGYIRSFDELLNEMRRIWHSKWDNQTAY